jgi:hypothetical protein
MASLQFSATVQMSDHFAEYEAACRRATKEAFGKAATIVRQEVIRTAPRASTHRVKRRYPGGTEYSDVKRITQSVIKRVAYAKDRPRARRGHADNGVMAYVRAKVGYSVFQNYGYQVVTRRGVKKGKVEGKRFMQRALQTVMPRLIPILKGEWPR